jgi:hypothetical protein
MTEHDTAGRLAEKHGARVARAPEPFPNAIVMEPGQLAALIADVRRQALEEAAGICDRETAGFGYTSEQAGDVVSQTTAADMEYGAKQCARAIRAKLEEGK